MRPLLVLALALAALAPVFAQQPSMDDDLDASIESIEGKEPLPKFARVSEGIYRSGQPNRDGLASLAAMGVKTVLSLRFWRARGEEDEVRRLGMRSVSVPMEGIRFPEFDEADVALSVLADPKRRPILLHCAHGRDRTGTIVAAWRVVYENRDVQSAVDEARGFGCCPDAWRGDLKGWLERYRRHARLKAAVRRVRDTLEGLAGRAHP